MPAFCGAMAHEYPRPSLAPVALPPHCLACAGNMSISSDEEGASFFDAQDGSDEAANESAPTLSHGNAPALSERHRKLTATATLPAATDTARRTSHHANKSNSRARNRYSLPASVPDVPAIPEHHLVTGKRATLLHLDPTAVASVASKERRAHRSPPSPLSPPRPRSSSSHGASRSEPPHSPRPEATRRANAALKRPPVSAPTDSFTRRKSFSATAAQSHAPTLQQLEGEASEAVVADMERLRRSKNEDLFLELANDPSDREAVRPPSRGERASSRLSLTNKRRSLPSVEKNISGSVDKRPSTSGNAFGNRPSTRLDTTPSDLQRHTDRFRSTRVGYRGDDVVSLSGFSSSGRRQRYSLLDERSTVSPSRVADSPKSPELPHFGRRRPSFGNPAVQVHKNRPGHLAPQPQDSLSESPVDSSDPKNSQPDSGSVESETADTVWDELDELKSRIKKLELTGKMPSTSGAAISGESSERPRTATTAPTTIDSSPRHDKPEKKMPAYEANPAEPAEPAEQVAAENLVGGPAAANIHPNLHSALARARLLLSHPLYRSLEATAADALQLAAMTGSAGPQGTTFSAASIINGVTVSDRHVRRKADTMCRNLTDLCIALCDGKHEAPSVSASPVALATPAASSPSLRYSRNSLGPNDELSRSGSRPMSRLEARRTSILGSQAGSRFGTSPAEGEDVSASEQETNRPSNPRNDIRGFHRSVSRLQRIRQQRHNDASEDEDPTIRPPSRAMTDFTSRIKPSGPREYNTPQRSPSLRDSLTARRAHSGAYESTGGLSRVSSLASDSGRSRRFHDPSTPPVLEEEGTGDAEGYQSSSVSVPSRRVASLNRHAPRRGLAEVPNRATSLTQRRHIVVE